MNPKLTIWTYPNFIFCIILGYCQFFIYLISVRLIFPLPSLPFFLFLLESWMWLLYAQYWCEELKRNVSLSQRADSQWRTLQMWPRSILKQFEYLIFRNEKDGTLKNLLTLEDTLTVLQTFKYKAARWSSSFSLLEYIPKGNEK